MLGHNSDVHFRPVSWTCYKFGCQILATWWDVVMGGPGSSGLGLLSLRGLLIQIVASDHSNTCTSIYLPWARIMIPVPTVDIPVGEASE